MFKSTPRSTLSHSRRTLLFGVGINDVDYMVSFTNDYGKVSKCPYYLIWKAMLQRCFDPKLHEKHPTYKDCTVDPTWLSFSTFKGWMEQQDWQNKCLDKDLLSGKHYSPSTCLFISPLLNGLLLFKKPNSGDLPAGVTYQVKKGIPYFVATCCKYGKQETIGYFNTVEEASEAYRSTKLSYISELASKETDPRIVKALLNLRHTQAFT